MENFWRTKFDKILQIYRGYTLSGNKIFKLIMYVRYECLSSNSRNCHLNATKNNVWVTNKSIY